MTYSGMMHFVKPTTRVFLRSTALDPQENIFDITSELLRLTQYIGKFLEHAHQSENEGARPFKICPQSRVVHGLVDICVDDTIRRQARVIAYTVRSWYQNSDTIQISAIRNPNEPRGFQVIQLAVQFHTCGLICRWYWNEHQFPQLLAELENYAPQQNEPVA